MRINPPTKIYAESSPVHGLGVFASQDINEGEVLEVCPVIDMGMKLGEVSNILIAAWRSNLENNTFEFYSIKDIKSGEEVFVWYGDVNYWNDGRTHISVV
jgi:SET domain-containing protein